MALSNRPQPMTLPGSQQNSFIFGTSPLALSPEIALTGATNNNLTNTLSGLTVDQQQSLLQALQAAERVTSQEITETEEEEETDPKPSYDELLNFYLNWKDIVPYCRCKQDLVYGLDDYRDRDSPNYPAAHTIYKRVANEALRTFELLEGMANYGNQFERVKATEWVIETLKVSTEDQATRKFFNQRISSLLSTKKHSNKKKKEADTLGISVYKHRQTRMRSNKRQRNEFSERELNIIGEAEELLQNEEEYQLRSTYPPKIENGQLVAIAWNKRLTFGRVLDDVAEGENKHVDVSDIKMKKGGILVLGGRKNIYTATSTFIISIVQVDQQNRIIDFEQHESHYKRLS
uniref:Uncharacterized protein n=2 Tax=Clytia hemisphaerica TaxID=252671 RepID=A0A7M5V2V7_9CNID